MNKGSFYHVLGIFICDLSSVYPYKNTLRQVGFFCQDTLGNAVVTSNPEITSASASYLCFILSWLASRSLSHSYSGNQVRWPILTHVATIIASGRINDGESYQLLNASVQKWQLDKTSHPALSNDKGQRCTVIPHAWQEKNQKYWWLHKILVYHIYYSHFINE